MSMSHSRPLLIVGLALFFLYCVHGADHPKPHSVYNLGQHRVRRSDKRGLLDTSGQGSELTPLFPGYGTHFTYAYVGTPPQRQSLIIDTGSHYTAFPCTGCEGCGKHTDAYWSPKESSTKVIPQCTVAAKKTTCNIEQSYSEGSSWKAYRVTDKLWVSGIAPELVPGASNYAIDFEFGCQTSATGLFVTQLADGIIGMSNGPDTLPAQLKEKKVTTSSVFALCFRIGGGIMTLGGVDQRIHTKRTVLYAANVDVGRNGWFSVEVRNILLRSADTQHVDLPISANKTYLGGSSTSAIIDSGTTDTYLPTVVFESFKAQFKEITGGIEFKKKDWLLSKNDLKKLPSIVFRIQAAGATALATNTTIDIVMPWINYLDKVGEDMYSPRIGFTEQRGSVVLGANFMTGYNVIFDSEGGQIGFAQSACNYAEFDPIAKTGSSLLDGPALAAGGKNGDTTTPCKGDEMIPTSECTAVCNRNESAYVSTGTQQWKRRCSVLAAMHGSSDSEDPKTEDRVCKEVCAFSKVVRGTYATCPDRPWTDCTHGCIKSRQVVSSTEKPRDHGQCNYHLQTSTCYAGICPLQEGDYLVYVDLRVRIEPWKWSYVYTEHFFAAMATLFKLNVNSVELLNDAGSEYTQGTKLHFKLRLKAKDYKDVTAMHKVSDYIVMTVRSPDFGTKLVLALDVAASKTSDVANLSRFGWMSGKDIEVLSAIAMPTSGVRATGGEEGPSTVDVAPGGLTLQQTNLLLLGVALGALLLLAVVIYLHMRLRHAHALYEKDKGTLSQSGRALHKMFNSLASSAAQGIAATAGVQVGGSRADKEVELSEMGGLMEAPIDEDLED